MSTNTFIINSADVNYYYYCQYRPCNYIELLQLLNDESILQTLGFESNNVYDFAITVNDKQIIGEVSFRETLMSYGNGEMHFMIQPIRSKVKAPKVENVPKKQQTMENVKQKQIYECLFRNNKIRGIVVNDNIFKEEKVISVEIYNKGKHALLETFEFREIENSQCPFTIKTTQIQTKVPKRASMKLDIKLIPKTNKALEEEVNYKCEGGIYEPVNNELISNKITFFIKYEKNQLSQSEIFLPHQHLKKHPSQIDFSADTEIIF